jgi:hypothetical protein
MITRLEALKQMFLGLLTQIQALKHVFLGMIMKLKVLKHMFRVANKDSGSEAGVFWDDHEVKSFKTGVPSC